VPSSETPMQLAVAVVAIVATAILAYEGTVESGVFASTVTLILGYVFGRQVSNGNGATK